jgi:hypothetical protein
VVETSLTELEIGLELRYHPRHVVVAPAVVFGSMKKRKHAHMNLQWKTACARRAVAMKGGVAFK